MNESVFGHSYCLTGFKSDLIGLMKFLIRKGYHFQEDYFIDQNQPQIRYLVFSPKTNYIKNKNVSLLSIPEYSSGKYKGLISVRVNFYHTENEDIESLLKEYKLSALFQGYDGSWEGFPYYIIFSLRYKNKLIELINENKSEINNGTT